jgi:hypothetical protein
VNREAELKPPSRVACSDLLDHMALISLQSIIFPLLPSAHKKLKRCFENHRQDNNDKHHPRTTADSVRRPNDYIGECPC